MKSLKYYLGMSITGLIAFLVYSCKTSTPGDAVKAAMEKEIIKEEAEESIDELNVPAVVVEAFSKDRPDTMKRTWLVYKAKSGDQVKVELPEVYIVAFKKDAQDYRIRYSREGDVVGLNRLIEMYALPEDALNLLHQGAYKDWEVVGDVFETLDNITNEPIGFLVKVQKEGQRERLFFDTDGNILKIQQLTQ